MKKSTYVYLIFLSILFASFGSVNSSGSGLAFFLGEVVGVFCVLYLGVLVITGAIELAQKKLKKT